ncbi:MAG: orotate phosphoribosyltransferase [Gemmataceae bacterium]|nr:orotate phosphoribosyltransferase [Gemmataceae bacterium]
MSDFKHRLHHLLATRSLDTRGPFKLASGDVSSYYFDGKMTEVSPEGAYLIGEVIRDYTADIEFAAVGGLEAGAIPLTTAAVIAYYRTGRQIEGFWVRDAVKSHGTRKLIEGALKPGSRVVIVDDVVTRGESALKAIRAVREKGCEVARVLALVDRLKGARDLYAREGIEDYQTVFTVEDFGVATDVVPGPAEIAAR